MARDYVAPNPDEAPRQTRRVGGVLRILPKRWLASRDSFCCHSPRSNSAQTPTLRVRVWIGDALAMVAVETGVSERLMEPSA